MADQGADFRTVLPVMDETVAELATNLRSGSYSYVAHIDATGHAWVRGVDDEFATALALAAPTSAAAGLVTQDLFRVQHRDVSSVPTVDRGIQLLEVLSERLGEKQQLLCLTENGVPARVFGIATASVNIANPDSDDEPLLWITDMPHDKTLFDQRVLFAGSTAMLRTRLGFDPAAEGSILTLPRSKFEDRKVEFDLTGRNVKFREVGASANDASGDSYHIRSRPVDANGGDSFEVQLVPERAGDKASIRIRLYFVSDGEIYQEQSSAPVNNSYVSLDFQVLDTAQPLVDRAEATPPEAITHTTVSFDPPAAVEWIRWDSSSAEPKVAFDRDGQTLSHFIHADEGTLTGEYRQILKELWKLGGAHQVSASDPLLADETGPANLLRFAQLGSQLHSLVYGASASEHRDFLASEQGKHIAQLGRDGLTRRIRITDEKHGLPWALFYDHGYDSAGTYPKSIDDVDIEGFWGYRFRIDHDVRRQDRTAWQPHYSALADGEVVVASFVNDTVVGDDVNDTVNQELVAMNDAFLGELDATINRPGSGFQSWLATDDPVDILYLFGHGKGARSDSMKDRDEQASIELGGNTLTINQLRDARGSRPWPSPPPLVFVNACETMRPDLDFRNPFVELFYRVWHARAVVGCFMPVNATFAAAYAGHVLGRLCDGYEQLGDAMHRTTRTLLEADNPYGLIYALYGHSELHLRKDTP